MKMNLTLGVNKHNVAWHVCDQIKVPSGGGHYIVGPCRTRSTGPCECSATARPPSHSLTSRQTYKPDEGVAPANEQRVASIHHDERVRLTGRGNHMNQACVHTTPSVWAWCNGYPSICISSR